MEQSRGNRGMDVNGVKRGSDRNVDTVQRSQRRSNCSMEGHIAKERWEGRIKSKGKGNSGGKRQRRDMNIFGVGFLSTLCVVYV